MVYRILKRHDAHFELQYQDAVRRWVSACRENPFRALDALHDHMIAKGLVSNWDDATDKVEIVNAPTSHGGLMSRK